ncbi:hypothetical protein CMO92_04300 [Candidatus Woesearchaeota archaeon]|nr:hypothetical protein [Candidatus Woesearchaeota archaeon]
MKVKFLVGVILILLLAGVVYGDLLEDPVLDGSAKRCLDHSLNSEMGWNGELSSEVVQQTFLHTLKMDRRERLRSGYLYQKRGVTRR